MRNRRFFEKQGPQSEVKSLLVTKYLSAWAKVILGTPHPNKRLAYVDLFCGPGEYSDGTPSTPMRLLEMVLTDEELSQNLTMFFNDVDPTLTAQLDELIGNFPNIERLAYRPDVCTSQVDQAIFEQLKHLDRVPTLYFLDPCGYKGLSQDLVHRALSGWGCDCILFFNYNRISGAVNNPPVIPLMRDLFGVSRFSELQAELTPSMTSEERQTAIVTKYEETLKDINGAYVLPFEFQSMQGERTSHYVYLVTKHFRGYSIMKDIMYKLSTDDGEVRRFEFVPTRSPQLSLFNLRYDPSNPYSIRLLKELLQENLKGQSLRVDEVYQGYSVGTPYTKSNFKKALRELEDEGRLAVDKPPLKRMRNGAVTMGDDRFVTFK